MGTGKSKISRVDQQAEDPRKELMLQPKPRDCLLAEFLFAQGRSSLYSFEAFNWLDEAHPHEGGQPALLKVHQFKS